MWQYVAKIALTAAVVVAVAEVGKRSSFWGAAIASLPLTSLLAFVWLYAETGDVERVAALSQAIFWLVIPSLVLFLALPPLLRSGLGFWPSVLVASAGTVAGYFAMIRSLAALGIRL
jgi:hypothetical protein